MSNKNGSFAVDLAGTIVERTLAQDFAVLENNLVCGRQNPSWIPLALSNQNVYTIEQSVFVERTHMLLEKNSYNSWKKGMKETHPRTII